MRTIVKFGFKLLAVLGLGSFASLAAAGIPGAIITYGPVSAASASIPTISGSLLIALAVLLMLVAFRLLKDRPHAGSKLVIAVAAITALATGAGGIKLVADAHAGAPSQFPMTNEDGGTLTLPPGGPFQVFNNTNVTQEIKKIENNCLNGGSNGGQPLVQTLNGGQTSKGTCQVSTRLAPATEYCEITVGCDS